MLEKLKAQLEPYLNILGSNQWLQALVVLILMFFIAWILDRYILALLRKLTIATRFELDNQLLDLLHKPIHASVIMLGIALAASLLQFDPSINFVVYSTLQSIAFIIWAAFIMRAIRLFLRHVSRLDHHVSILHSQTLPLFENIANILIVVVAVYIIFSAWNIDMTAWLASAGIIGIAVGFAAKDTLANLFSGVFILADAPYKIGDFVVLDTGERGEVTQIGIRSTRLLTRDDVEITVPNSIMGNTKVTNESGGTDTRFRIRVAVGVAYGSDIDKVREILTNIALANTDVCRDPEPRVRFRNFGASSLDFELLCWIDQPVLRGRMIDSLNCAVYKQFIEDEIEIPYSKHDLYIKEMPVVGPP
jgi:MscS family membrane protein